MSAGTGGAPIRTKRSVHDLYDASNYESPAQNGGSRSGAGAGAGAGAASARGNPTPVRYPSFVGGVHDVTDVDPLLMRSDGKRRRYGDM